MDIMASHPHLLDPALEFLKNLLASEKEAGEQPQKKTRVSTELTDSSAIGSCYWILSEFSVVLLQTVLAAMEPMAFNKVLTRSITTRGKKNENKTMLLELVEFCTGFGPKTKTGCKTVGELKELMCHRNASRGRRASQLALPADWDTHGAYQWQWRGEDIYISHKFVQCEPVMALGPFDRPGKGQPGPYIEDNYSESDAKLKYLGKEVACILLLPQKVLSEMKMLPSSASSSFSTPLSKRPRHISPSAPTGEKKAAIASGLAIASGGSSLVKPGEPRGSSDSLGEQHAEHAQGDDFEQNAIEGDETSRDLEAAEAATISSQGALDAGVPPAAEVVEVAEGDDELEMEPPLPEGADQ
jgi:hypothetical protein